VYHSSFVSNWLQNEELMGKLSKNNKEILLAIIRRSVNTQSLYDKNNVTKTHILLMDSKIQITELNNCRIFAM
jgi:hypothetical protein